MLAILLSVFWSSARIVKLGGCGMRILKRVFAVLSGNRAFLGHQRKYYGKLSQNSIRMAV